MSKRWMLAVCAALAVGAAQADVSGSADNPTKTAVLDMGPGCRIRMEVPQKAGYGAVPPQDGFPGRGGITIENPLNLQRKTYIEPFYLRFFCHDADPEALSRGLPVRYDAQAKTWRRDIQKLYDSYSDEPDAAFKKVLDRAVRFYELRSINATGFAVTQDDVIGEESSRRRVLDYCLFYAQKAVCSSFDTRMGYVADIRRNPRHDLTTYALKILRSIEFIDEAVPAAPSASQPEAR